MRRLVPGSTGSTRTVTAGNTDCNVRQKTLGPTLIFPRTRVTINTHMTVKLKGKFVLIIAKVRATGVGVASLDRPETKPVPSSSEVKLWDIETEVPPVMCPSFIFRYSGVLVSHT